MINSRAVFEPDNDIIAVDYDPVRNLIYWIDGSDHKIKRATIPRWVTFLLKYCKDTAL